MDGVKNKPGVLLQVGRRPNSIEAWAKLVNDNFYLIIIIITFFVIDLHISLSVHFSWRRGGLLVSALDSRASVPGSSPVRGHCVVFMAKTLHSHSASLHPGV